MKKLNFFGSLVMLAIGIALIYCGVKQIIPGIETPFLAMVSTMIAYGPFIGLFLVLGGLAGIGETILG